jgi:ligand-binding sensor domain-containing protein/two-component sensor histidine kinase
LCLLFGLLAASAPAAWAQKPLPTGFRSFTLAEGLPHRQVNCLLQDQAGLLWAGTGRGLARLDGERFEAFGSPAAGPTGLLASPIYALAEEPGRALWAGTPTGLRRLDLRTGSETIVQPDPAGHRPADHNIHALLWSRDGQLYAGTSGGWLLRRRDSLRFERVARLPHPLGLDVFIWTLREDEQGSIWLSALPHNALYRYDPRTRRLHRYAAPSGKLQWMVTGQDPAGGPPYVSMSRDGVYRYDPATDSLRPVLPAEPGADPRRRQPTLAVDGQHRFWYGWEGGSLERYDPATGERRDVGAELPYFGYLQCALNDRSGSLWLGTHNGLLRYREPLYKFATLLRHPPDSSLTRRYSMRGLLELPNGRLLASSYQGLLLLDPSRQRVERRYFERNAAGRRLPIITYALLADPDSASRGAWAMTEGAGLMWLDLRSGRFHWTMPRPVDERQKGRFGRALARDARGHLWAACYEGLVEYAPQARTLRLVTEPALAYLHGYALLARGPELWLAAEEGLFVLHPGTTIPARRVAGAGTGLRALWLDPATGELWLGSTTGLRCLTATGQLRHRLGRAQGLADEVVDGLLPGPGPQLWVSTDNGLSVVDRHTLRCTNFFLPDGISDNEFNVGSALRTRDGELWLGTINGLTRVRPRLAPPQAAGQVQLTRLSWFDGASGRTKTRRLGLSMATGQLPQLTLHPGDLFFSASFVLTDYDNPANQRYLYHLEGFDRGWNPAEAGRSLRYTSLPPGDYTLWLRAAGRNGRWLPARAQLHVQVLPPLYARWWFVLLATLAGTGAIWLAWRQRLRQVRQVEQVRTRLAADLHDEVGAWLTRVSMHAELARTGQYAPERQQQQLARITEASRQAIATMSDVVWAVDARNDRLGDLLGRMQELAEALLTPAGRSYTFRQQGLNPSYLLPPALRQNLFLIYKEALHNYLRHSAAPEVRIFLGHRDGALHLEIADDGPPRTPAVRGSGQGLRNMELRARSLRGAQLTISHEAGYKVHLQLPPL